MARRPAPPRTGHWLGFSGQDNVVDLEVIGLQDPGVDRDAVAFGRAAARRRVPARPRGLAACGPSRRAVAFSGSRAASARLARSARHSCTRR
jgi:hypothetical protein